MEKIGSVAIFGAGIAGMQASLDLAEMGFKVHLIDTKPCIGGVMAQLDKTFPTNDCAMCILSPKLVDIGRHPNIEIITNAYIKNLQGQSGNFNIRLLKKPRFIDELKCNGCGDCAEKCPVNLPGEHDEGVGTRKAIYRRYPQAIPNIFSIDKDGIPPCRDTCPAHVNVQGYIALISAGEYKKAYDLIRERHPLPSVCGRICHHPCETVCYRKEVDEPVAINYLKRFAGDYVLRNGVIDEEEIKDMPQKEKKVAIVGAGPAGLTAAKDLAENGYQVTIFEREKKPGGTLYTGIPTFRLNKEILFKEADLILKSKNIDIKYSVTIGKDTTLKGLKNEGYEAVFIATGATKSRELKINGIESKNVVNGMDFLNAVNTGERIKVDGVVLVIGGGNVATDSARTALRLGAKKVIIVYRRTRKEMPAYSWEIREALEEGIEIYNSWTPDEVIIKDGRVTGIKCIKFKRVYDIEGNYSSQVFRDESIEIDADYIITAIGQVADDTVLHGLKDIKPVSGKRLQADSVTLQTNIEWIFAGGDVITGPASAVEAVAAGHKAAESIRRFIENKTLREGREWSPARIATLPDRPVKKEERKEMPVVEPDRRVTGFAEIELGYSEEAARAEAMRCLNCGACSECMLCVEACGREAVNHLMKEEEIEIHTGAIILATGFEKFDPSGLDEYGYRKYANVITSVEFERILSASGPFGGSVIRPSDHKEPKKIAWIQCVGSRQMKEEGNVYCSSVCCMYSIKEALIAKEHLIEAECHIYFMDIRAYGKDFDKYYERARDEYGVKFRRARLSLIEEIPGTADLVIKYVDENEEVKEEVYDMIVLSTGIIPSCSNHDFSDITGLELNKFGFIATHPFFSEKTNRDGIYVCGTASAPRDIPETVATASASASYVSSLLKEKRNTLVVKKEYPEEKDTIEEEPRIGVFVCHCGINIGGVVDVSCVAEYAKTLPCVVHAEDNLYTCSQDTQEKIKGVIAEHNINRVVVAACTPRTHESLFQDTLREAGLNPFLFEFVGIREQCSWVHMKEKDKATEKAKELVAMGASKARLLTPFKRSSFTVLKRGLVIGGGVSGMTSSLNLADQGFEVYLVEKESELGGNLKDIHYTIDNDDVQGLRDDLINKLNNSERITVFTDSEVKDTSGYVGNYKTVIMKKSSNEEIEIEHGIIIISTGAVELETDEYLYGKAYSIITQLELEKRIIEENTCHNIAMIQCVGSRDDTRPYCSRVCCQEAMKNILKIKEKTPDAIITVFYRDIRTYGFYEEYYQQARELGVNFIRYDLENKPVITLNKDKKPIIKYYNILLAREVKIETDLLVLSTGMEPPEDKSISNILKIPLNKEGFFLEAHAKLKPLDFATEGIYLCGTAHSPKNIAESISQAAGAAARAVTLLSKDKIQSAGMTVQIKERICSGCGLCVDICPFDAREIDEETHKARIIEVLCQGCGACATVCPNAATQQTGFMKSQIFHMIEEVV